MNTSSCTHRPPSVVVATAVAGLIVALLSATLDGAHAIPDRIDSSSVVAPAASTAVRTVERACFITPPTWNVALDGPLPRCLTYVR